MIKGEYYIGDLCYVLHERWDEVCKKIIHNDLCLNGEFELDDGTKFALYSTAYGDGTYFDQNDNEYWVDAGSIGCILMEDINLSVDGNQIMGGRVVDMTNDFTTGKDGGVLKFGGIHIDTDPVRDEVCDE
jgi:hypothetical protein